MICSKLWTDTNINFKENSIRHCCKQQVPGTKINLDEIKKLNENIFEHGTIIQQDRQTILNSGIPYNCVNGKCGYQKYWNKWDSKWLKRNSNKLFTDDFTNYIELDLSNECDQACMYCGPWSSSTWAKELDNDFYSKQNTDIEWKEHVLNALYKKIENFDERLWLTISILGGEPTLMPDLYIILEKLLHIGKTKLEITLTSNLNTKPILWNKLLNYIKSNSHIVWNIGVSVEDIESRAELIRHNLNWKRFVSNLLDIAPHTRITFTPTINTLCLPYFDQFIDWCFDIMPTKYGIDWVIGTNAVYNHPMDIAFLPKKYVDMKNIEKTFLDKIDNIDYKFNNYGRSNTAKFKKHLREIKKRLGTENITKVEKDWYNSISNRRGIDYTKAFPHVKEFI